MTEQAWIIRLEALRLAKLAAKAIGGGRVWPPLSPFKTCK
jgi:hypothetical protein